MFLYKVGRVGTVVQIGSLSAQCDIAYIRERRTKKLYVVRCEKLFKQDSDGGIIAADPRLLENKLARKKTVRIHFFLDEIGRVSWAAIQV